MALATIVDWYGGARANVRTALSVRHPSWLAALRRMPPGGLSFREPEPPGDADIALAQRLISAYEVSLAGLPAGSQTDGMWSVIFASTQQALADALARRDARRLASLLGGMFQSEFVLGISYGTLYDSGRSGVGRRLWWLKGLDLLLPLAEAVGAVRAENREQEPAGNAYRHGVDPVVRGIESRLGFSIVTPDVGAPVGIETDGGIIGDPDHILTASRIGDALALHLPAVSPPLRVVEIGGGSGELAYWVMKVRPDIGGYVIIDLPIANILQGYYLSKALGADQVSFMGETPSKVQILPEAALADVAAGVQLVINKDSMPEMPAEAARRYLEWIRVNGAGLFFSCNQEAGAVFDGVAQNVVPELVGEVGGFRRLRRDASWIRPGYVEEIYEITGAPSG